MTDYPYRIAVVHWNDAVSYSDGNGAPRHAPAKQVTIGWLLQYDQDGISVAFEYGAEDQSWREEQFVPAGMIERVDYLDVVS